MHSKLKYFNYWDLFTKVKLLLAVIIVIKLLTVDFLIFQDFPIFLRDL